MKIKVLGSGSKGNSTLIETTSYNILIDAGLTLKNIEKRLKEPLPKIDILLITHTHKDHISGIKSIIKKHNPLIYTLSKEVEQTLKLENIAIKKEIENDELMINLFKLSHDAECCGILLKEFEKELVYITDTGYINEKVLNKIREKDIYIIESNHDEGMLRNGPYPFHLQQRIRGDKGHLSNEACSSYLKKIIGQNTKYIVLAHLSEENNKEELVEKAINNMLNQTPNKIKKVYIAKQYETLEAIEV